MLRSEPASDLERSNDSLDDTESQGYTLDKNLFTSNEKHCFGLHHSFCTFASICPVTVLGEME
jgi:hypothetical protein